MKKSQQGQQEHMEGMNEFNRPTYTNKKIPQYAEIRSKE